MNEKRAQSSLDHTQRVPHARAQLLCAALAIPLLALSACTPTRTTLGPSPDALTASLGPPAEEPPPTATDDTHADSVADDDAIEPVLMDDLPEPGQISEVSTAVSVDTPTEVPAADDVSTAGAKPHQMKPVPAEPATADAAASVGQTAHPLAKFSDQELEAMLLSDPASLGPASLGYASRGALLNAVPMPTGAMWTIVNPYQTWGTRETNDALIRCIEQVNRAHPGTQPVFVGDISERNGGHIAPHNSHQSGRDVDVGYYYKGKNSWYTRARASNLDLPRTWTFVRAMITETDVQAIFIDRKVQRIIKEYALSIGEDPDWLRDIFNGGNGRRALITHQPGHATHIHVRFYNPIAQETGRRIYPMLIAHKKLTPPTSFVRYKIKRGDRLGRIARRYKTSVKAIKRANRMRSTRIYAGRSLRIPRRGGVTAVPPLVLPARRLPPPRVEPRPAETPGAIDSGATTGRDNP